MTPLIGHRFIGGLAGVLGTSRDRYFANAYYDDFKRAVQEKELDIPSDTPTVSLIDTDDYTFDSGDASYASDVDAASKVAAAALSTPAIGAAGVFDSDDWTFPTVTGDQCEALITWLNGPTTPVADPLMAFYDTGMTGMPVTPSGGDINGTVNGSGWHAL